MAKRSIKFVKATQDHIDTMKGRLREFDEAKYYAVSRTKSDERLQRLFENSVLCWAVLVNGRSVICWGINRENMLSNKGMVWLLTTDGVCEVGFRFIRHARKYAACMLTRFSSLEAWVDVQNKAAVALLEWCGFTIEDSDDNRFCKFRLAAGGI